MQYTYKSLALVWLIIAALFGMGGASVLAGPWRLLLVLAALAAPFLLRTRVDVAPAAVRSRDATGRRVRSSAEPGSAHVYRWEDDGGAARMKVAGMREPVRAAR